MAVVQVPVPAPYSSAFKRIPSTSAPVVCKFFPNCSNVQCTFYHPKVTWQYSKTCLILNLCNPFPCVICFICFDTQLVLITFHFTCTILLNAMNLWYRLIRKYLISNFLFKVQVSKSFSWFCYIPMIKWWQRHKSTDIIFRMWWI